MSVKIIPSLLRHLARDRRALAYIEFALSLPLLLVLGLGGLEAANYALTSLKMSQIAANLADTASRISETTLSSKRIREADINDAFQGVRLQAGNTQLTTRGRVILSSLERNPDGGQWIHWQRCIGMRNQASAYGAQGTGAAGTAFPGMGPAGKTVMAPPNSAVMYVELYYQYRPLVSSRFFGTPILRSTAALIVREARDLSTANNPANPAPAAIASTCDRLTT